VSLGKRGVLAPRGWAGELAKRGVSAPRGRAGETVMRHFIIHCAVAALVFAASSTCFAQGNVLPIAPPPEKKPCEVLTKAEAESIMGQPADLRGNNPFDCWYVEAGWTNKPPKNRQVRVTAHTNPAPQPNELADTWKNMADHPMPTRISKNLPNFVDGGIWNWYQGHGGELFAYKAGVISVSIIVSGLSEEAALGHAKRLAANMLGGSQGTGYVYNTPKIMPRMDKPPVASADALPPEKPAPVAALQGGKTFTEAVYITAGQFLQEVKEVSLTVVSSATLGKYIPDDEIRRYVVDLLNVHRVSVKPNAPVALQVSVDELLSDFTRTDTYRDQFVPGVTHNTEEGFHAHTLAVALEFFVRTAVWRNGDFHPIIVAPVRTIYFYDVTEARALRKQLMGDETRGDMQTAITDSLTTMFKDIATGKTVDETPWPVSHWSEKEKAAANAAFGKARNVASPEKRPTAGLDSTPKIELNPELDEECGKADPSWRDFWSAEFVRQGWVKPEQGVRLEHSFNCRWIQYLGMDGYFHLIDIITLYEPNVVFELHGKFFRKRSALFSTYRMMTTMGDRLMEAQQGFIPRSIMQFFTDLTLGKRRVPPFGVTAATSTGN
jgi:hypothetical protein